MIRYTLKCDNKHEFDSWFGSSEDYQKLASAGLVNCAICGSADVSKAIMAPRLSKSEEKPALSAPASPAEQAIAEMRKQVEKNADNVGTAFANEARKIHSGEAPERAIYGEAKPAEARELVEEGVPIVPLPWNNRKTN